MKQFAAAALVVALTGCAATATAATAGHKPTGHTVYPATATGPAAGICNDPPHGHVLTVTLYDDMSDARCYEARPSQELRIVNRAHRTARMHAPFLRGVVIRPGRSYTLREPFRRYLALGDHGVGSSLWCCFGFDLYLPGATPTPTPAG